MARTLAMRRAQQAAEGSGTAQAGPHSAQKESAEDIHQENSGSLVGTSTSPRKFVTPVSVYDSCALSNITNANAMTKVAEPAESDMTIQTPPVAQSIEEDIGANTRLDNQNKQPGRGGTPRSNSRIRRHRTADYALNDYLTPSTPPTTRLRPGKTFASEPPETRNPKPAKPALPNLQPFEGRRRPADKSLVDYLSPAVPPATRLRPRSEFRSETPKNRNPRPPQKTNLKMLGNSRIRDDHHQFPSQPEVEEKNKGTETGIEGPGKDVNPSQRRKSTRTAKQTPTYSASKHGTRRRVKNGDKGTISQRQPHNPPNTKPNKASGPRQSTNVEPSPSPNPSLIVKLKIDPDLLTGWQLRQSRTQAGLNGRKRKHGSARSDDAKSGANKVTTTHTQARAKVIKRRRQVSPTKPVSPAIRDDSKDTCIETDPTETGTESRQSPSQTEPDEEQEGMYADLSATCPSAFNDPDSFIDLTRELSPTSTEEDDPTSWALRIPLPAFPLLPQAQNVLENFAQGVSIALENIVEDYHAAEERDEEEEGFEHRPVSIAAIVDSLEDELPQFEIGNYYDYRLTVLRGNEWVYNAVRRVLREVDVDEIESELDSGEEEEVRRDGPRVEEVCAIVGEGFRAMMARAGVRVKVYKRKVARTVEEVERRRAHVREVRRAKKRREREWAVERDLMVEQMERERRERRATEGLVERERDVEGEFRALLGMSRATSEVVMDGGGEGEVDRTMTAGEKMRERLERAKRIEELRDSMRETSVVDKLRERMRRLGSESVSEIEGREESETQGDDPGGEGEEEDQEDHAEDEKEHEEDGEEEPREVVVVEDDDDDHDDHDDNDNDNNRGDHKSHKNWRERVCVTD